MSQNPRWESNRIQFPRLLAEIISTQELDISALCEAMDLEPDELDELFDRAQEAWEKIKLEVAE